jgi:hypothetical protein
MRLLIAVCSVPTSSSMLLHMIAQRGNVADAREVSWSKFSSCWASDLVLSDPGEAYEIFGAAGAVAQIFQRRARSFAEPPRRWPVP